MQLQAKQASYARNDQEKNQQNKPLDVLHELEVGPLGGDLLHRAGADLVDQVAENNPVSQDILEAVNCYEMSWTVF